MERDQVRKCRGMRYGEGSGTEMQRDEVWKCRRIRYGNVEGSGREMQRDQVRKCRGIRYGNTNQQKTGRLYINVILKKGNMTRVIFIHYIFYKHNGDATPQNYKRNTQMR